MNNQASHVYTLSEILKRMSLYMDKLAAQIFELESAVGDNLKHQNPTDPMLISNLQSLDFLRQSFEDLAVFMLLLTSKQEYTITDKQVEKILCKLKLQATRSILTGSDMSEATRDSDSIDLF